MKHLDIENQLDLHPKSKEHARLEYLRRIERIRQAAVDESKNHNGLIDADLLARACSEYENLKKNVKGTLFHDARFVDTGTMKRSTIPKHKRRKITVWAVNIFVRTFNST